MVVLLCAFIPSSNLETIFKGTKTYSYKIIKRILITSRFFFLSKRRESSTQIHTAGRSDICWLSANTGTSHVDSKDTGDIIKIINLSKLIKVPITLN